MEDAQTGNGDVQRTNRVVLRDAGRVQGTERRRPYSAVAGAGTGVLLAVQRLY